MSERGALGRVLRDAGGPEVLSTLAERLPGADLTTLLLAVFRARAARRTATEVLRRYAADRFAPPGSVPFARLRRAEDVLLAGLPAGFEVLTLAPVVPLGTHSAVAPVGQNKVLSTIRSSEVAADPTNGLALEAALRRGRSRARSGLPPVRLAALQRVVRAQGTAGAASFTHFTLFGVVSAGRDTGNLGFERAACAEQVPFIVDALLAAGVGHCEVRLTAVDAAGAEVARSLRDGLAGRAGVVVREDAGRDAGTYYSTLCFKVFTGTGDGAIEVADGGFVGWTRSLLGDRKERLLISGVGVDRLALALPEV